MSKQARWAWALAAVVVTALVLVVFFALALTSEVLRISVSIGIARWPEHGADVDALMQAADRAMYRCKHGKSPEPVIADPVAGPPVS